MTAATERLIARRNTRAFIDADKVAVVLRRPTLVATPAGGHKSAGLVDLPPQTVRIVPLSGNVWDRSKVTTDEGNIIDVTMQLVGMPDLDVKKGDIFDANNDEWLVTHVSSEDGNRKSANIKQRDEG